MARYTKAIVSMTVVIPVIRTRIQVMGGFYSASYGPSSVISRADPLATVSFAGAFVPRFLALCSVGVVLLLFHWFISRYVRSSMLVQAINLTLALIPVAGTAFIMSGPSTH